MKTVKIKLSATLPEEPKFFKATFAEAKGNVAPSCFLGEKT
jgi:hypothetical protein